MLEDVETSRTSKDIERTSYHQGFQHRVKQGGLQDVMNVCTLKIWIVSMKVWILSMGSTRRTLCEMNALMR